MELIRQLVSQEFCLFNVGTDKAPATRTGQKLKGWEALSYAGLCKEHNYNSTLWGMRMGLQENGRRILSLDFDICGKPDKKTGVRSGCAFAKQKLDELLANYETHDGLFSSSTLGNMNLLVDYTDSPQICDYVTQVGLNKFHFHELEILLGGNQVIPPSATTSKITKTLGPAREFQTSEMFHTIEHEDGFVFQFIENLFKTELEGAAAAPKQKRKTEAPLLHPAIQKTKAADTVAVEDPHAATVEEDTEIQKLLRIIGSSRCSTGHHTEWVGVGQAIKNELGEDGIHDFLNWTFEFGSANKKKEASKHYSSYLHARPVTAPDRLSIKSIHFWAKEDDLDAYEIAFPPLIANVLDMDMMVENDSTIEDALKRFTAYESSTYAVALCFKELMGSHHVCVDNKKKEFYNFNKVTKLWASDFGTKVRLKFSEEFKMIFRNESDRLKPIIAKLYENMMALKLKNNRNATEEGKIIELDEEMKILSKHQELLQKLFASLEDGPKKSIYLSEFSDLSEDIDFVRTLNRAEFLLPTSDGFVLDMRTLELLERTIEQRFTYQCGAKFIPFDENDPNFQRVIKFFTDLFCGNEHTRQCVLDMVKTSFIGKPSRYVNFCIGDGQNGKSTLFGILQRIFCGFMDTISEKAIIEVQMPSALNTEIEKLDKCRFAYVTELGPKDTLNEKTIKQVTGGDPINLRTLHTKDKTLNPTSNLWICLNEMVKFNGESKAMLDRLIVIPFNANFAKDSQFEKEMFALTDYFFSYIMYMGRIMDKFDLSDEMVAAAQKHASDNTDTTLADYLKTHLVDCVNDRVNNKLLSLNYVRLQFENHCKLFNLKNPVTQRKFPEKLRSLGYTIRETHGTNHLCGKKFKLSDGADDEEEDMN